MWDDPDLEAAYARCCDRFIEPAPCHAYEYLLARHEYHKLLVARGQLTPELAEKDPRRVNGEGGGAMAMMDMFAGRKPAGGKPQMASKGGLYMKPAVTKGRAADRTTREIVAKAKSGQGTLTYTPRRGPRGR